MPSLLNRFQRDNIIYVSTKEVIMLLVCLPLINYLSNLRNYINYMKSKLFLFLFCFCLCSCIEEYQIKNSTASDERQLVIQGRIATGDQSVIYVSYTQPLGSEEESESVLGADIKIIGQNGYESTLAEFDIEKDCYVIDTQELPANTLYALQVELDGKSYHSEFLSLQNTPEIEDLSYTESDEGISLHLKVQGNDHTSPHYMWSHEEDWEFHAPINFANIPGIIYSFYNFNIYQKGSFTDGHNAYYYCWGHNASSSINLYSTENLEENRIDVNLFNIPIDDVRISYIYSLQVKLYSLSNEAYRYYHALKSYTEGTSGLFPTMPTEIKGNIACTSHSGIKVQGYVLAANVQTKRIFIYESEFKHIRSEYESNGCMWEKPEESYAFGNVSNPDEWQTYWSDMIKKGAMAITTNGYYDPFLNPDHWKESVLYHRECIDCHTVEGATKKRPDFWPNNHE